MRLYVSTRVCVIMPSYKRTTLSLIFVSRQLLCTVASIRINASAINAIVTPELKTLFTIFEKHGYKNEIRIVGGAVRDLLDDKVPADWDLATVATPQEMKNMFGAENIHTLNERGEIHGTITVRINHKENFEISTLRNQTMIDGVAKNINFIKDWRLDSTRRDFTINAMYLDSDGNLYDYHNGYEDLKNNKVKFIGEADRRIEEDPRLILRYFRVLGKVTKDTTNLNHDETVLQAIRDNASGLDKVFGERIWRELQQILTSNFVQEIVTTMVNLGLAPHMALGGNPDDLNFTYFDIVCNKAAKYQLKPITFIAVLLKTKHQVSTFCKRMKLSRFTCNMAYTIIKYKNESLPEGDDECFKYCQRILIFGYANIEAIRAGVIEILKFSDRGAVVKLISEWTIPHLPIDTNVLKEKGIFGKERVGQFAKKLKDAWFDNAFVLNDDVFGRVLQECLKG